MTLIQRCLLSEKELSFKTALEIVQGIELSAKNVKELNIPTHNTGFTV